LFFPALFALGAELSGTLAAISHYKGLVAVIKITKCLAGVITAYPHFDPFAFTIEKAFDAIGKDGTFEQFDAVDLLRCQCESAR
jgi:hypothetical protein